MAHKHMTDEQEKNIIRLIRKWPIASGNITWPGIILAIKKEFKIEFTRQTLSNRGYIAAAYKQKKGFLKKGKSPRIYKKSMSLEVALETIQKLEAKNEELKNENGLLLEQIARWAHNAIVQGYNIEALNKPLPPKSQN